MAEVFNPNAFYDYSYEYKFGDRMITKQLKVRASDSMIWIPSTGRGDRYYKGIDAYLAKGGGYYNPGYKPKKVGWRGGTSEATAAATAFTEGQARYTTYKTGVTSQQASDAQARGAALRQRVGKKASDIAERRQLKKPTDGKPKARKGAKVGGVAALKKPVSGVVV